MLRTRLVTALLFLATPAAADEPLDQFIVWMTGPWADGCTARLDRLRLAFGKGARVAKVERVFLDAGAQERVSLSIHGGWSSVWASATVSGFTRKVEPWHAGRDWQREASFAHGAGEIDVQGRGDVAKMVKQLERAIDACFALVDAHVKKHGAVER